MPLSWIEIDLGSLRHNYDQVRRRLKPTTHVLGVVKSDAYGHGMIPVAVELEKCGIDYFGVSKFWEAEKLRDAGIKVPILLLLGIEPEEMEEAIRIEVRPVLYRLDHARQLSRAALRLGLPALFHLKVDTGMGRLGVPWDEVDGFLDELLLLPGLKLEGVISHFAAADEVDKAYSEIQTDRFRRILRLLARRGCNVPYAHIANSAGVLDLPEAHFQLVRPGIMLYGSSPSSEILEPADLHPVMAFKSKILQIKDVAPGTPIGYGKTYVTERTTRVATLPIGYDDGYPRLLSNRGHVLVRGKRAPVVGRISMNMTTVDVTEIPEIREDDEAVILGRQGSELIQAEEIAARSGTISYEIYCHLGHHEFKVFLNALDSARVPDF